MGENMENIFDTFRERGFVRQCTDEQKLRRIMAGQKVCCYIGFDPTAESFHVGSLVPIMALSWMERAGHKPIVLMGGGTALLGDPAGKTEARQLMPPEKVKANILKLKKELRRVLHIGKDKTIVLNNAAWLARLNFVKFMREIGFHFKANVMTKAESYKRRVEEGKGMPYNEFSYPLLQAYDFLHLFKEHDCILQMGGSDQWGNITGGIDLIKVKVRRSAHGLTFPLLEIDGKKIGQTGKGRKVWLNPEMTSPYDFFQFWINIKDKYVTDYLRLFTFLPIHEIYALTKTGGASLNEAKKVLAYEVTRFVHGKRAADTVRRLSDGLFNSKSLNLAVIAKYAHSIIREIEYEVLEKGILPARLFAFSELVKGVTDGKRLIDEGAASINRRKINRNDEITADWLDKNGLMLLQRGKKKFALLKAVR